MRESGITKFKVGDVVVVTDRVKECAFSYNQSMLDLIGREVEITSSTYSPVSGHEKYHIDADGGEWTWDDVCFAFADEADDSQPQVSEEELFEFILSGGKVI